MAKSIIARQAGDEYQDDWFWMQAARGLRPGTHISRLGYEIERASGFDDVAVFYDPPIRDELGKDVAADYYQVKFHVDFSGALTASALTDHSFVRSTKTSLLQRAQKAGTALSSDSKGFRLFFVTPWTIHPDDPLAKLISTQIGEIRFHKLFEGGHKSEMGSVRRLWAEHLALDREGDLGQILAPLHILANRPTQADLRQNLNVALTAVGLASAGECLPGNPYHGLIRKLHREGKTKFSPGQLRDVCKRSGLVIPDVAKPNATRLGIRSFLRWADNLEDETDHLLDLLPCFDNRMIRNQDLWNGNVLPELSAFLERHVSGGKDYILHLDAHSSIAFSAGYVLDPKCGAHIMPVQRTLQGQAIWDVRTSCCPNKDEWDFTEVILNEGKEMALAVSVTHDTLADVKSFVSANLPQVGRIVHARIKGGPQGSAVRDGNHAFTLAQQLIARARQELLAGTARSPVHLFFAAPNALVFFAGRNGRVLGNSFLYEYEFETNRLGGYRPSISLPLT